MRSETPCRPCRPWIALLAGVSILWLGGFDPLGAQEKRSDPMVSEPVAPLVMEKNLRAMPTARRWAPGQKVREIPQAYFPEMEEFDLPGADPSASPAPGPIAPTPDPLLSPVPFLTARSLSAPIVSFDGIPATGSVPPDTVGDVGPDHYVQMVNTDFAIFDKQGNVLAGPSPVRSLWSGFGGACESENDGDPIVQYDHLADRWLLSQFAVPGGAAGLHECIAISRTPDPVAGGWFLYDFQVPVFPDYPKISVWPDAYYMSTFEGGASGLYAFDRVNMLNGQPASFVRFTIPTLGAGRAQTRILPANLDGPMSPPVGSPNYFVRSVDGGMQGGGADRLEIYQFSVDFDVPALATFTGPLNLPVAAYDIQMCGPLMPRNCIPQPGTGQGVDPLSNRLMRQLQYRNFGTHETMVVNQTVDVGDFNDHAGIRWYELRRTGGNWFIQQQGTHSPDATHRWMGDIAMDGAQNIALGYSVSSNAVFPGIRYAGREAGDPAGTLPQPEIVIQAGGGSQTAFSRWGDYSSMDIDPVDDCTFWFTTEYYAASSAAGWRTRIASFVDPGCLVPPPDPQVQVPGGVDLGAACVGDSGAAELDVCNTGKADLTVTSISSSNAQFAVTTPSAGFPVVISPDFCFPFQVTFTPAGSGSASATLTVNSDDPTNPMTNVSVSGDGGEPDIRVTGSTDFGVASVWTPAERNVAVCNTGACNLAVSAAASSCPDFTLIHNPFPATVSPDSCLDLTVRFTPVLPGAKSCNLTVNSNDPDTPVVNRVMTARTPPAMSFYAGLAMPTGTLDLTTKQGSSFTLGYLQPFQPQWAWDVRLNLSSFDGDPGFPDVDLLSVGANFRFTVNPGAPVRFYLGAGLGVYHFDPGDFEGGGTAGLGLSVPVGARYAFEAAYNHHWVFTASPSLEYGQANLGFLVSF